MLLICRRRRKLHLVTPRTETIRLRPSSTSRVAHRHGSLTQYLPLPVLIAAALQARAAIRWLDSRAEHAWPNAAEQIGDARHAGADHARGDLDERPDGEVGVIVGWVHGFAPFERGAEANDAACCDEDANCEHGTDGKFLLEVHLETPEL